MSEDDMPDWRQQEENEQQRFEEEQAMLAGDPGYLDWLDHIAAEAVHEHR